MVQKYVLRETGCLVRKNEVGGLYYVININLGRIKTLNVKKKTLKLLKENIKNNYKTLE